jgi:hypothetical protein
MIRTIIFTSILVFTSDDINYVPGLSVTGNEVVSADINSNDNILPKVIKIPVTIDIVERFDIEVMPGVDVDADFGILEIYHDGRVVFNDKDIADHIYDVCEDKESTKSRSTVIDMQDEEIIFGEGN